jgi:YHS domain-containing protein
MVVDPVCGMTFAPEAAATTSEHMGRTVYFCSQRCHAKFVTDPLRYTDGRTSPEEGGVDPPAYSSDPAMHTDASEASCAMHAGRVSARAGGSGIARAIGIAVLAGAALLVLYFGLVSLVSGVEFMLDQFAQFWPFVIALAIGFGVQVGMYTFLRNAVHAAHGSGKVVAVSGTTSGAAMVSCCAHYLVNLLPALGATGLITLIGQYQVQLFWFGLAANAAGIAYVGSRVIHFVKQA